MGNSEKYGSDLIKRLRKEANYVKDCFTKFSFWALGFTAFVIGFIAKFQGESPYVGFSGVLLIIIILAVARIGVYKYSTHNRNLGYELHLCRIKTLNINGIWKDNYNSIGWEEAMRAWRVIQPTVFYFLYDNNLLDFNILRKEHRQHKHRWFEPTTNICENEAIYESGSYLRTMNSVLYTIAGISFIPLTIMEYQLYSECKYVMLGIGLLATIWGFLQVSSRIVRDSANRRLLEKGLLSIHSCSILWQATVVAHYRALNKAKEDNKGVVTYRKYTNFLSKEAADICRYIFDIHYWIDNPEKPTKKDGKDCKKLEKTIGELKEEERAIAKTCRGRSKRYLMLANYKYIKVVKKKGLKANEE